MSYYCRKYSEVKFTLGDRKIGSSDEAAVTRKKTPEEALRDWRQEMDTNYNIIQNFSSNNPALIFEQLASMTARFSQIRTLIVRTESKHLQNFRTKEVDPFLAECDRQFKIWSRMFSVQSLDWEMTRR